MDQTRIEAVDVGVHFGNRSALEHVELCLRGGESISVLGPNGAGKSTLLNVLAGLLPPTHGEVRIDGQVRHGADPAVIYVPQRSSVDWSFPISVLDVTLLGHNRTRSRFRPFTPGDRQAALAALAAVGMEDLHHVQIGQLSGGQQQRVFLARALLQHGSIYLLDEPFTGVDVPTQGLLVGLFADMTREGKLVVYATHDLALAAASADRVVLLNRRVVADGPPATTMTAEHLRRAFGGQVVLTVSGEDR